MRLIDYLDKGAMLGEDAPCLTMGEVDLSYAEVQRLSHRIARGLQRAGIDLSTPQPIHDAVAHAGRLIDELEGLFS